LAFELGITDCTRLPGRSSESSGLTAGTRMSTVVWEALCSLGQAKWSTQLVYFEVQTSVAGVRPNAGQKLKFFESAKFTEWSHSWAKGRLRSIFEVIRGSRGCWIYTTMASYHRNNQFKHLNEWKELSAAHSTSNVRQNLKIENFEKALAPRIQKCSLR
jgi:hypothetical protein